MCPLVRDVVPLVPDPAVSDHISVTSTITNQLPVTFYVLFPAVHWYFVSDSLAVSNTSADPAVTADSSAVSHSSPPLYPAVSPHIAVAYVANSTPGTSSASYPLVAVSPTISDYVTISMADTYTAAADHPTILSHSSSSGGPVIAAYPTANSHMSNNSFP